MRRFGIVVAGAVLALVGAGGAAAHGDPTSHYLETDDLLVTFASPPPLPVELQLRGLLNATAARGYPMKVSLIASTYDTGGDTPPLEDTQAYAEQVSAELGSLRGPVLIVTPRVIGVAGTEFRDGRLEPIRSADARALVRGVPVAGKPDGTALANSAMRAIRTLAREAGRPLPASVPPAAPDTTLDRIAASHRAAQNGSLGTYWIVALVLGTVVVLGGLVYAVSRSVGRAPATGGDDPQAATAPLP